MSEQAAAGVGGDGQSALQEGAKIGYKEALVTDERYVRSSWVAILIMAF